MPSYVLSFDNQPSETEMLYAVNKLRQITGEGAAIQVLTALTGIALYSEAELDESMLPGMQIFKSGRLTLPSIPVETEHSLRQGRLAPEQAWHLGAVGALLLRQQTGLTGAGTVVAIIDSGISQHPDLVTRLWVNPDWPKGGKNFIPGADPTDVTDGFAAGFHGTLCAGAAVGASTGIAPGAQVMVLKVFSTPDDADTAENSAMAAVDFAILNGANVISMSMSTPQNFEYSKLWSTALEACLNRNIPFVCAAGNKGEAPELAPPKNIDAPALWPPPWSPVGGDLNAAVAIGAYGADGRILRSSARGPVQPPGSTHLLTKPDFCAPGDQILTTNGRFPGPGAPRYVSHFGFTSAATPIAAGCFALLVEAARNAGKTTTPARMYEAFAQSAKRMSGQRVVRDNSHGFGGIDVHAAFVFGKNQGWW